MNGVLNGHHSFISYFQTNCEWLCVFKARVLLRGWSCYLSIVIFILQSYLLVPSADSERRLTDLAVSELVGWDYLFSDLCDTCWRSAGWWRPWHATESSDEACMWLEHSEEEHETQLKAAKKAQVAWDVFTAHVWFVGARSSLGPVSVQFRSSLLMKTVRCSQKHQQVCKWTLSWDVAHGYHLCPVPPPAGPSRTVQPTLSLRPDWLLWRHVGGSTFNTLKWNSHQTHY